VHEITLFEEEGNCHRDTEAQRKTGGKTGVDQKGKKGKSRSLTPTANGADGFGMTGYVSLIMYVRFMR
jgi:hypothetical protein